MAVEVVMPNLGFDAQSGRLVQWLKQPGDPVSKGEPIAVIESDKANVELEALSSGVLLQHNADEDDEINVGAVIARIGTPDEYQAEYRASTPAAQTVSSPTSTPESPTKVSPLAQRIARDLQVNVSQVVGSGTRGRITRRDVEAHAAKAPTNGTDGVDRRGIKALPSVRRAARERGINLVDVLAAGFPNPITLAALNAFEQTTRKPSQEQQETAPTTIPQGAAVVPLSRMRQAIGRRLSESMREAPHFYVTGEFDFERAMPRLETLGAKINDLLLYLTAQTLIRVPNLNRTLANDTVYQHSAVHLAIAVARDDGLITPVLRDAGRYSLQGIAAESRALIERARNNRLSVDDIDAMQGGTFTISNMGMVQQVDHFTAVLNPPQVGILAVGALKPRPVVVDGGLFIRRTAHLTLSGDHRVVDGMDLARFMAIFAEELERFSR
jgi:pyruvate dehydrogenase E2 component (dihydrolipoamide acetyltransferase)